MRHAQFGGLTLCVLGLPGEGKLINLHCSSHKRTVAHHMQ